MPPLPPSRYWLPFLALLIVLGLPGGASAAEHRLGFGLHYWKALDDLVDDRFTGIEDSGVAWVFTYKNLPAGLFSFQADLEYNGDGFGGATGSTISPIGLILIGHGLYGGLGLGVTFGSGLGGSISDPFFLARVGWEFLLLPKLRLDLNADYRAGTFRSLDNVDTNSVTFGAGLRFTL